MRAVLPHEHQQLRDAPRPDLPSLLLRDCLVGEERKREALLGGLKVSLVLRVGAQRAERDDGVHAVHGEQFLAVQVPRVLLVLGVGHVVAREGTVAVGALAALRLIEHDDGSLVPLRGDRHLAAVLGDVQIHADAVHHARHRLDLRPKRELQLLHAAVIVLARVEHRAALVLAVGELHEEVDEDVDRGTERARERRRLGDERRGEVHVHGEEQESSRALVEALLEASEDAVLLGADVRLGDDVEASTAARALAVDLDRDVLL
mmetsp:Transcript_6979/g.28893  ORF Transcript_6979/g.28893 Transcript_6979/m.28893 type:complete len:262 (+) Transcript_6979:454-1239(+)